MRLQSRLFLTSFPSSVHDLEAPESGLGCKSLHRTVPFKMAHSKIGTAARQVTACSLRQACVCLGTPCPGSAIYFLIASRTFLLFVGRLYTGLCLANCAFSQAHGAACRRAHLPIRPGADERGRRHGADGHNWSCTL